MTGWELPALGAFALVLIVALILVFAKGEKAEAKKGAIAEDDRKEAVASLEAMDKAEEVGRATPKTARALRDWLRGGRV